MLQPVEWIAITGGKFIMGTPDIAVSFDDARPTHEVNINFFYISKTPVTVEQYAECVYKDRCTEPRKSGRYCNWGKEGREFHPINCVDWYQASRYARFKDGRLPSESEWEYAARSGGKNQKYPWGDDMPTCDKAVMKDSDGSFGCGANGTMAVCSKVAGNTEQGLCDMAGNVWQWVKDIYQDSYRGAPVDGSAFERMGPSYSRVFRGGFFGSDRGRDLRSSYRRGVGTGFCNGSVGFRIAK